MVHGNAPQELARHFGGEARISYYDLTVGFPFVAGKPEKQVGIHHN
jgi:hypothetical protein